MYLVMHAECGQPALVFLRSRRPKPVDYVDWGLFVHVNGRPISPTDLLVCDSCGRALTAREWDPDSWRPIGSAYFPPEDG